MALKSTGLSVQTGPYQLNLPEPNLLLSQDAQLCICAGWDTIESLTS